MNNDNKSNYKGKYYDPNYHENKRKYGDSYDPKRFAVRNPNWEPQSKSKKRKSNNRNSNYNYRTKHNRHNRSNAFIWNLIGFVVVIVLILNLTDVNPFEMLSKDNQQAITASPDPSVDQASSTQEIGPDVSRLSNNQEFSVEPCNLSGSRQANVKVDVGYGDREYYGYTNEYQQLGYGYADTLKLQNSATEETVEGRYCTYEAAVAGTESH